MSGSDDNLVIGNRANDNLGRGIWLSSDTAFDNVVKMNKARNNMIFDVDDESAGEDFSGLCGSNQWSMNVFITSGNACID